MSSDTSWAARAAADARRAEAIARLLRSLASRPLTTDEAHAALDAFDLPRRVRASFIVWATEPMPRPVTVGESWERWTD